MRQVLYFEMTNLLLLTLFLIEFCDVPEFVVAVAVKT